MIDSILWALPAIALVFVVTTATLRRAPARGLRRLLVVNGLVILGTLVLASLLLLGAVEPAQAADAGETSGSWAALLGAGIAVAGEARAGHQGQQDGEAHNAEHEKHQDNLHEARGSPTFRPSDGSHCI